MTDFIDFARLSQMDDLSQKQQYELAFHLLPSFEEEVLEQKRRELEELISKNGGVISRSGEIKKTRLAYPIKNEVVSNFGYIEFFAPGSVIDKLNKELLLNENFLRHMILKRGDELAAAPRRIVSKPRQAEKAKSEAPEKTEVSETEQKELDKKIEEILEKI